MSRNRNYKTHYNKYVFDDEYILKNITVTADGCWTWNQARSRKGYGHITFRRKSYQSHRLSYQIFRQQIPAGLCVLHRCDNPPCCNPAHLFLGTQADNIRDAISKGRLDPAANSRKAMAWLRLRRGSLSPSAKLTEPDVRRIRNECLIPGQQARLAKEYGVDVSTIRLLVKRKTWAHVV